MENTDRHTLPQQCALCGATRALLAYRVGGGGAELTCLDVDGCESRRELVEGKGRTFDTAAEAIEWLTEKEGNVGLDTTHDCWHGAYSAFNRWRTKIAGIIGIPLELMDGYYGEVQKMGMEKLRGTLMEPVLGALPIPWEILKPDPLIVLLDHSDSDGYLPWEECEAVANRLEEVLPELTGDGGGHIGSYQEKTKQFIEGLRLAASCKENVEFH